MARTALEQCIVLLYEKAKEQREAFGDESRAKTLEWAASVVESAARSSQDEVLTLEEAQHESGYHPDSLSRMIREGRIPDLRQPGSHGPIRIRRGDLPHKPGRTHTPPTDVVELASRLGVRGKGGHRGRS